jgi:hypothetical protein
MTAPPTLLATSFQELNDKAKQIPELDQTKDIRAYYLTANKLLEMVCEP